MIRIFARLCILSLLPLLASCATKMQTEVTRFHVLTPASGETLEIQPVNPALQNSIEFNHYADLVGAKLGALGYKPPVKGTPVDLIVRIDYGIQPGPGAIRDGQNPVSIGLGMGVGSHHSSFGFGMSTAVGDSGSSSAPYIRWFTLTIDRASDHKRLFEGRAVSQGKTGDLNLVMPYMIDALFADFPGKSGEVKTVTVNAPD